MFIDPAAYGTAFDATDIETSEVLRYPAGHAKAGKPLFKRRFIPARLTDNPYLSAQGDYEAMLLSLPEQQRRQLLEGDWDIKEGAAFTEFNRDGGFMGVSFTLLRLQKGQICAIGNEPLFL